ncbi:MULTISPECIES: metallophosphoesterase [Ensifer]|jgi:3',5'-cyclic AMP phosphodiesterase CpdA|uniref:Phosphatase n=1 Tax=Ensifer canadensis TaxID=555315 RepID=A0AAW4FF11_9HYPH|nr:MULTISPECIES: metallophosphoesterase [Ensifer]MDP9628038.1 3',5'-cyclic AMP phosphodiesterase CpdA [Ensifer adhaerens]KQU72200.1 phosphatase [Ensifer sp. Root31]KQW44387.1 phosphatase [Ensifer sp. Root1252]KQY71726.1 phosphatase [Ensifer sp. Root142]KRC58101.1 phosphatase [Ensifer sp. Root231]
MHADTSPLLRFGVIADPQYAAVEPNLVLGRYYANSLTKLAEAIETFNAEDLAFVVTLGDIIDRGWQSFDAILPLYDKLRHPKHFLLGNHDFGVDPEKLGQVFGRVGMPSPYQTFAMADWRFVLIDGNEVSLFAPPPGDPRRTAAETWIETLKSQGADNAHPWNAALGDVQFAWLEETLRKAEAAGEQVVVMGHYPVYPPNAHNMWDSQRIVDLFGRFKNVGAYFCGHNHDGNYGLADGTHFVNIKGMVETPDTTAYAIVEIHADRMAIRGYGRETDRTLQLETIMPRLVVAASR